ncbi:unnamed protein product [Arabis nemorensis]|uniref:Uncharacterized protein n=1 Tax=Arabis nemorensis TaxID=586526 RepID=A0A565AWI5_9BRAS|nr:unnamed protein product [Arabis nemorensis]
MEEYGSMMSLSDLMVHATLASGEGVFHRSNGGGSFERLVLDQSHRTCPSLQIHGLDLHVSFS